MSCKGCTKIVKKNLSGWICVLMWKNHVACVLIQDVTLLILVLLPQMATTFPGSVKCVTWVYIVLLDELWGVLLYMQNAHSNDRLMPFLVKLAASIRGSNSSITEKRECFVLLKSDVKWLTSLDFAVTRFLMKLFRTSSIDVITDCRHNFSFCYLVNWWRLERPNLKVNLIT